MKHLFILTYLFFFPVVLSGQNNPYERVVVNLDKDCYFSGETILAKFYVVDDSFLPSDLSKVGYIEICDTERPHLQHMLVLENGRGAGKLRIPESVPSGIYELTAYTRFMRNEGNEVFFRKQIAIVNMLQESENDRINLISGERPLLPGREETIKIVSDKSRYKQREPVQVEITEMPADVENMIISVVRNDSIANLPLFDYNKWKNDVITSFGGNYSLKWLPEYEGHIVNGKIIKTTNESVTEHDYLSSTIGFVGKDIRVLSGQVNKEEGIVSYFTSNVYGPQELVSTILLNRKPTGKYRVDILSPFAEVLPTELPELKISPENKMLLDRFVGIQLNEIMFVDSVGNKSPVTSLYNFSPVISYDLDEYTRFNTVRQTIVEFILRVVVRKINDEWRLRVFLDKERRFNNGSTLVLLDGVPLFDHNLILDYNPHLIKKVDIYDGKYAYGEDFFECMVAFTTHNGNLPSIQLGEDSQLFVYNCPELPDYFQAMPDYSNPEIKNSPRPDFRHTLFWDPFAESIIQSGDPIVFYTSDLTGDFIIQVEGITRQGELFYGKQHFRVEE